MPVSYTHLSLFALIYLVGISFRQSGNGSIYLGSVGILALVAALVSFVQAVKSLREEDTFRGIPIAAMVPVTYTHLVQ